MPENALKRFLGVANVGKSQPERAIQRLSVHKLSAFPHSWVPQQRGIRERLAITSPAAPRFRNAASKRPDFAA